MLLLDTDIIMKGNKQVHSIMVKGNNLLADRVFERSTAIHSSASSSTGTASAEEIVSGDPAWWLVNDTIQWRVSFASNSKWMYEFTSPQRIDRVRIHGAIDQQPINFNYLISDNGIDWVIVKEVIDTPVPASGWSEYAYITTPMLAKWFAIEFIHATKDTRSNITSIDMDKRG